MTITINSLRRSITCLSAALVLAALAGDALGRGFGGFHGSFGGGGGGFRGFGSGGFRSSGFSGGGLGGGFRSGGFSSRGFSSGGFRTGGLQTGGFRSGGLSGLGGNRGGVSGLGGLGGNRGGLGGNLGGGLGGNLGGGLGGNRGGIGGGLGGNRDGIGSSLGGGLGANRGDGRLGGGNLGQGGNRLGGGNLNRNALQGASRSQLSNFLGLPSDGGVHSFSPTINNIHNNINTGNIGQRIGNTAIGSGAYAGRGLRAFSNTDLYNRAAAVRRNWHGAGIYTHGWYARYPGAWHPAAWGAGYAWRAASWSSLGAWLGYAAAPVYFDYGNNVVYQGGNVYINNQDVGSDQQYYQQAQSLVTGGAQAPAADDTQWLPLGVFAVTTADNASANMTFQLAVNKQGVIRGNYTNTVTQQTLPLHGSVDKSTQRAAWSVGDITDNVYETGIYNLTKDEAPMLVHFGANKTEQWLLVRMKQDQASGGSGAADGAGAATPADAASSPTDPQP